MSEKHTHRRLKAVVRDLVLEDGRYRMASNITPCGSSKGMLDDIPTAMANARRLAACWNNAEGVSTEEIEKGTPLAAVRDKINEQAHELAAAHALLADIYKETVLGGGLDERIRAFLKGQP